MTVRDPDEGDVVFGAATHEYDARIYYADTDFSGVVYYGRYLEYLERGRSDLLHAAGITHRDLLSGAASPTGEPLAWVVRRIEIDYRGSARIEDAIRVHTSVTDLRGARIEMAQRITLDERTILDATVRAALITLEGRPARIPVEWIRRLGLA